MLIIVEGVDGSGKSTLVENIASHWHTPDNCVVHHCGPLRRPPLLEYLKPLIQYKPDDTVVADRWHVGELVYGPLYRGHSALSQAQKTYLEMFLDSRGALKVAMLPDYEMVSKRLEDRGEDFLKPEHLRIVMDFYETYARDHNWVEMRQHPVEGAQITNLIKRAKVKDSFCHPGYVGSLNPKYIFVGSDRAPYIHGMFMPFLPYSSYISPVALGLLSAIAHLGGVHEFGLADPYGGLDEVADRFPAAKYLVVNGDWIHHRAMKRVDSFRVLPPNGNDIITYSGYLTNRLKEIDPC